MTGSNQQQQEGMLQNLRLKANEYLLREQWDRAIQTYSQFISLSQTNPDLKHQKSLTLAYSNRAEARSKTRDFDGALKDCDEALDIETNHFKTLMLKGKILLNLDRYSSALNCFKIANLDNPSNQDSEVLKGYLEKCKKLEFLSRSGAFDFSTWVLNGFKGKLPELGEYIGGLEIKKSEISGRGLVANKNIDVGSLLVVTKAVATERGILPESKNEDLGQNAQMVMWKNFIDKVVESSESCERTRFLISKLSNGENEDVLEVPDISIFRPELGQDCSFMGEKIDIVAMLSILDVNSLVEEMFSSKFTGKNGDYHGVGIWVLASFINHSCNPNAKRYHIGDHVIVHASRDIKEGEEITLGYFDVFSPLKNRKEMAKNWGFDCHCKRCKFEDEVSAKNEMGEIEMGYERGVDVGMTVYKLEESLRRWMVRGKMKGYLRASFWKVYSELFVSEKLMRKWGRKVPTMDVVVESIVEAVGGDERVLRAASEGMKRNGGGGGVLEMEKVMKLGRGVYGKLLGDYAKRFHEIKTPRKLLWKKNLGTVKLELEFEDRTLQFTVTPVHATIILKFQEQTSWTSKSLAAAIGLPVDTLQRRVNFWISKGIVAESSSGGDSNDHLYTLVDSMADGGKTTVSSEEMMADDDAKRSVASVEDQLRKEMTVYEKFIIGMLKNFGCMALDRIHNTLKMFCSDPAYDKSLQQLQSFLSGLAAKEKLELRDGMYYLKK